MIRATMQIIKAIHKYKDEFPILFNDYVKAKDKIQKKQQEEPFSRRLVDSWITISDEGQQEYLSMVKKHLQVKNFPNNNRKVVISTHNGGKYVGFYENGKWWYRTAADTIIEETGIVIKWEKNYF